MYCKNMIAQEIILARGNGEYCTTSYANLTKPSLKKVINDELCTSTFSCQLSREILVVKHRLTNLGDDKRLEQSQSVMIGENVASQTIKKTVFVFVVGPEYQKLLPSVDDGEEPLFWCPVLLRCHPKLNLHEDGKVSAYIVHRGSCLSNSYLSFAAAMNALAGPLYGLANRQNEKNKQMYLRASNSNGSYVTTFTKRQALKHLVTV
uniref:Uncharacterized protein n=1 Tax=Glossina palpalis gambiensis TaxID=67801 RepID=A0A1B0C595_9MUSC